MRIIIYDSNVFLLRGDTLIVSLYCSSRWKRKNGPGCAATFPIPNPSEIRKRDANPMQVHNLRWHIWIPNQGVVVLVRDDTASVGWWDGSLQVLMMQREAVSIHYLRSWFLLDFVASFPIDLLFMGKRLDVWRLPRLLKIFRVLRYKTLTQAGQTLPPPRHTIFQAPQPLYHTECRFFYSFTEPGRDWA